jgi:Na+-translocating ferredoxin:NAD+ oxidoreductase RNF subunit RnfB
VVDTDLRIGCGVCVHKCKTRSITLKRRDEGEIAIPPKNTKEMAVRNITAVVAAKERAAKERAATERAGI